MDTTGWQIQPVAKETSQETEKTQSREAASRAVAKKKEPPPFAWKLTGYADGLTLTLLKCIEKKDAEAQKARLECEGYYTGLMITPLDAPVSPPPNVRKKWEPEPSFTTRTSKKKTAAKKKAAAKKKPAAKKRVPVRKKAGKKAVKKR